MIDIDVAKLTEWLGPEGAVAGLDRSIHTNADLMMLARKQGIQVEKKTARKQIAIELVMSGEKRISKDTSELMKMSRDELARYFGDTMASESEIRDILNELEIAPKGKLRGKLSDFAAREISDLGMYDRVAQGRSPR
tara:strand:- start:150 stop:560 length:411 start_codon:yes stop_codon:yes gene_type:complete